jgi:hypothetical protein
MFDKWFNQDIEKVFSKRNRVVVVDESDHLDLLQKVLPPEYKVFVVNNAIEELECNYVPCHNDAAYRAPRKLLERIAREGRKYGLSLMMVGQRFSEVSNTLFAQCNNFLSLRLTNDADQNYVRRLFPDNSNTTTEILPNLAPGECVVVGDAVLLPAVIKMPLPNPEPHSQNVKVHKEWQENWRDITFSDVIGRWRK